MELTWEPTDADRELFERELDGFVPDRIYDVHAHLYELWQWKKPTILEGGPEKLPLQRYRREIQWITPGRKTHGLFFGGGLHEETFRASNEYVAAQVGQDPASRSLLIVSPHMDPEEVRQEVRRLSMVGLKVYQHFAPGEETWEAEIEEFLTEEHVRVAHEEELVIMLHMVKSRALADPVNQATIRRYCETWPRMRLVLAHSGTAFNPHHTAEGIHSLAGLQNVWFDTSAMTEAGAFEPIVRQFGHTRLMWGSDYPISHLRGRCVAIGDNHIWLYENNIDWDAISYRKIQPVYLGLESLRALKTAAWNLRLSDAQVEDVFWTNARKLLRLE